LMFCCSSKTGKQPAVPTVAFRWKANGVFENRFISLCSLERYLFLACISIPENSVRQNLFVPKLFETTDLKIEPDVALVTLYSFL
jgi:hypothetical protein